MRRRAQPGGRPRHGAWPGGRAGGVCKGAQGRLCARRAELEATACRAIVSGPCRAGHQQIWQWQRRRAAVGGGCSGTGSGGDDGGDGSSGTGTCGGGGDCGGGGASVIVARGGGYGGCGGGGGGDMSSSLIFLKQSLEREFTPFFLQMTTRVCGGGGVPSPLIEPKMGREGKGPT